MDERSSPEIEIFRCIIMIKLKNLIKESLMKGWKTPPTEKRWSGAYSAKDGLTEFERRGGKDFVNEIKPGPGEHGSVRLSIDDDTITMVKKRKIKFKFPYQILPKSNELWVWQKDKKKAEKEIS